jgi:hypothetical protein
MKQTRILQLVLCGPGDVSEEIKIAREVIEAWNQVNFDTMNCGIKAVHWSTDAVPSMRARGQQVINWGLIDNADLVVAIFWRRLGTPTGLHESGTAEEVRRAQARDIEVMLYFSNVEDVRTEPDPEQWEKLQTFRAQAMNSGLGWPFRSRAEFRKLLAQHLNKRVHEILTRTAKKKAAKKRPSISQKQSGTGNVQIAGDGATVNLQSTSPRPPKIVIEPSPGQLTPAEQKQVGDWVENLAILMESVQGKTTARAKGELWSRLKNQFEVAKYQQIESVRMPDVKAWYEGVRREIQNKSKRRAPGIYRQGKIPGIKQRMKAMGRTNEDYYPEIAQRLKIRTFSSLKDLSATNLDKVYQLVLRDAKKYGL